MATENEFRAKQLLDTLYGPVGLNERKRMESTCCGADGNACDATAALDDSETLQNQRGAQREYLSPLAGTIATASDIEKRGTQALVCWGRVWVYSQGIALHQMARTENCRAHDLANWLLQEALKVRDQSDETPKRFRGWHFSQSTSHGDGFKDPRLVTGANAWALNGIAKYIASNIFRALAPSKQNAYRQLYRSMLNWMLPHQSQRTGLFTSGMTPNILAALSSLSDQVVVDITKYLTSTNFLPHGTLSREFVEHQSKLYNPLLNLLGYEESDAYGDFKDSIYPNLALEKANNTVTEHNLDMMALFNFALNGENHQQLELPDNLRNRVKASEDQLYNGLFTHLYSDLKETIITGLDVQTGLDDKIKPSVHSAVDNGSWLALHANYDQLTEDRLEKTAKSLLYTCQIFGKYMSVDGKQYLGTHYFEDSFSDPYIERAQPGSQSKIFHIEATTGVILGLKKFVEKVREKNLPLRKAYTDCFHSLAESFWANIDRFVEDQGFVYGSGSIGDLFEKLESSTTATWYIDTTDQFRDYPLGQIGSNNSCECLVPQVNGFSNVVWLKVSTEGNVIIANIHGRISGLDWRDNASNSYRVRISYRTDSDYIQNQRDENGGLTRDYVEIDRNALDEGVFSGEIRIHNSLVPTDPGPIPNGTQILKLFVYREGQVDDRIYTTQFVVGGYSGSWKATAGPEPHSLTGLYEANWGGSPIRFEGKIVGLDAAKDYHVKLWFRTNRNHAQMLRDTNGDYIPYRVQHLNDGFGQFDGRLWLHHSLKIDPAEVEPNEQILTAEIFESGSSGQAIYETQFQITSFSGQWQFATNELHGVV